MYIELLMILSILGSSPAFCKQECKSILKHSFKVEANTTLSFSAEIKEHTGLIIDINYEYQKNDRVELSSKKSVKSMYNGMEYIETELSSLIKEGLQDVEVFVGTDNLTVTCTSSDMFPLHINIFPGLKSIDVSSEIIKICEERCSIQKNIEKNINHDNTFEITVFTNSKHAITFKMSNSVENGSSMHFELKPRACFYKWKQTNRSIQCNFIKQGWNRLIISVNRTSFVINNEILPVDDSFKKLQISGSYLVNCSKGTPEWNVFSDVILIPVSFDQEIVFVITSNATFSPVFNLDGNNLTLNWNKGLKFGSSGKPLQPKFYSIVFETTSEMLRICNKKSGDILLELRIDKPPEFIWVSSGKGEYWITLYEEDQSQQQTAYVPTLVSDPAITDKAGTSTYLTVLGWSVLICIIGLAVIIIIWKVKKRKKKQEHPHEEEGYESIKDLDMNDTSEVMPDQDGEEIEIVIEKQPYPSISRLSLTKDTQDTNVELHREEGNNSKEQIIHDFKDTQDTIVELHREEGNNSKEQIIHDFKELDDGIASIFDATKDRRLFGSESADSLLRKHGLPGTIRDRQGNSILHCLILTLKQDGHSEDADEIKKFLKEHNIFVSAVNYKGQTALHTLASEASKEDSSNKWESMAKLLIDIGCNSGVRDNNNQLPDDVASAHGCKYLQDLIRQKRDIREELDMETKKDQWFELLKATKENKIDLVTELLQANNPILPLYAIKDRDPLKVAIQGGHTELTMLLLSAGAPLCGRPLKGLNPLEVSHETPGLPVRLPALIRREYYNCLRSESEMLKDDKGHMNLLKERVIELAESVKIDGYTNATLNLDLESKDRSQRSEEARKMLSLAAEWGMGLTCQMLGLEDVFLHPLLHEISPDKNAKPNTLDVLYRDLELSLSFTKKREYEEYNMEKLRVFCKKNDISINSLSDVQTPINKEVLKFIAEEGLHMAYEKIFLKRNAQVINSIVDEVTGFTMLHSAAYSDRMGMVEFLLMHEADERMKTDKGFTAAHVAAIRGHRECMEYIFHISELRDSHISKTEKSLINYKTKSGLTASEISNAYASEIKNVQIFLLHESISHPILSSYSSEPKFNKQAKLVLSKKKSIIEECFSKGSLKHIIPPIYIKEQNGIWKQLKEESENFIKTLSDTDPRFKGRIIYPHKSNDALELMLMDSYQIYLELENNEHWDNHNLHKSFKESGLKAMMNFTVKSNNLCLLPTVFKATAIGAHIRLSYCSRQICYQLCIHVIPVLKTKFHCPQQLPVVPQKFDVIIAKTPMTHKVFNRKEKWSYVTTDLENKLLDEVDDDKLKVLSLCRFIKKLLDSPWWFPRVKSRRHGRQWHHYAVSHPFVEERFLVSSFLLEVFKHPEQKWNNQHIADRVLGVFENMVVPDAHCFLDQGKDVITVSSTIKAIVEFLRKFK